LKEEEEEGGPSFVCVWRVFFTPLKKARSALNYFSSFLEAGKKNNDKVVDICSAINRAVCKHGGAFAIWALHI
jgi:hypothetical protein